jgi:hypothetical protein
MRLPNLARGPMVGACERRGLMTTHPIIGIFAAVVLGAAEISVGDAGARPIVLAGATGGVCAAQLEKCTTRCRGSAVCSERCAANDRACRAGGKPVYR